MNRFTEIIRESTSIEDVTNFLIPINESLGQPKVATLNFGGDVGYIFKWSFQFDLEQFNGSNEIKEISKLFECVSNLTKPIEESQNFMVDFKIEDNNLSVRFTPKSKNESTNYQFIVGQNWRNIILDYSQISKFFRDNGFSLRSAKVIDNTYKQTSDIKLVTDADLITNGVFESLFNAQVNKLYNEDETMNRSVSCDVNGQNIFIYPDESQTYVIFNQDL
jgi:hypothetical protein